MTDDEEDLNTILIDCAKLRGAYPLMHRTLHEFGWFCSACIHGWTSIDQYQMDDAIRNYTGKLFDPEHIMSIWENTKSDTKMVYDRWNDQYCPGDDELIRLGKAFREYCVETYGEII